MKPTAYTFPENFRWGTATSSYQVEGHSTNNDWWKAAQEGGYIYQDQSAGDACDWWNRAEEDFDRMADMGQNAHRLSIEWSRIEPEPGRWDEDAIARYHEMISGMVARGIEPMVTLHHFTNPIWMVEQGGWENPESVNWFARYTQKVGTALGSLTSLWCTINEPAVLISNGYGLGRWPPGKKDLNAALHAAVHVVRAHAAAYHILHDLVPGAQVGFAKHMIFWKAYRQWMPTDQIGMQFVRHMFNGLFLSMVMEGIMRVPGRRSLLMPEVARTADWIGVNYYQRYRVRTNLFSGTHMFMELRNRPRLPAGPGGWGEFHAEGLFQIARTLWRRYKVPLIITENGLPDAADSHRPAFIVNHLYQLWRLHSERIPLLGYYFWSLLDNFEWTEGYDPRFKFGLFEVNFETQERKVRRSGLLYQAICKAGGLTQDVVDTFTPELFPQLFSA